VTTVLRNGRAVVYGSLTNRVVINKAITCKVSTALPQRRFKATNRGAMMQSGVFI